MAKARKTEQTATVVYCGPTIPGAANQFTVYTGGTPAPLAAAIEQSPALGELVVPLDKLPEVMRQLREGSGRYSTLYRKVQGIN